MTRRPDKITRQWTRTPADELAVAAGCYFDLDAAERVRTFLKDYVRIAPTQAMRDEARAAGKPQPTAVPFILLDWQWTDFIAPLFGWRRADGRRRFDRGYVSMGKKNGKSALGAGIVLYMLLADGEQAAECYSFAAEREQAGIIYRACRDMIRASPALRKVCEPVDYLKRIRGPRNGFFSSRSSEHSSAEGVNSSLTLYDELHAAKDRQLFDALRYAGAARSQPLMLTITTAGDGADAAHVCREQHGYGKGVIRGDIDDLAFFGLIYEAPEGCELDDPAAWAAANPSLGETIRVDDMAAAAEEAKASPAKESSFRRYRLNQWVSNASAWLSEAMWDACPADLDEADLEGKECVAGLDLSSTDDLTAAVFVFADSDTGNVRVASRFFLPADNVARLEVKHRVPYAAWVKSGHLLLTPGNVVDYAAVRAEVRRFGETHLIRSVGLDRGWQGQAVEQALQDDGFDVVPVGAGWRSQSQPLKELEKIVKSQRLIHTGNPVLRWNALNAVVKTDDADNYSLSKGASRSKIDGIAALVSALHVVGHAPAVEENLYEQNPELITVDW